MQGFHDLADRVVHFFEGITEWSSVRRVIEVVGRLRMMRLVVGHVQEKRLAAAFNEVNGTPSILASEVKKVSGLLHNLLVLKSGAGHKGVIGLALNAALGRVAWETHMAGAHVVRVGDAQIMVEPMPGWQILSSGANTQVPLAHNLG